MGTAPRGCCPDSSRPLSVSVAWDRRPGDAADASAAELPASLATGSRRRHKVTAFVGIFTGFDSVGRRCALRRTWLPADRQGVLRSEEATGLSFRFVIGKSNDESKMATLEREVEEYDDFVLLELEEEYSRLPYKTLAFFKAAYALFDSCNSIGTQHFTYIYIDIQSPPCQVLEIRDKPLCLLLTNSKFKYASLQQQS